jgi:hypothetical protein
MHEYIDIEVGVSPSGVFVPATSAASFAIANPFTPNWNPELVSMTMEATQSPSSLKIVTQAQLDSYAGELVKLGTSILQDPPDVVLVPCRGALKPWRQLEAMSLGKLPAVKLYATGLGSGQRASEIRAAVERALRDVAAAKSQTLLKVAVIDTAIGGHGARALSSLLGSIHNAWRPGPWQVTMHLIAPRGSYVADHALDTLDMVAGNFVCRALVYVVDDLLVEDWAPGYGLEIKQRGSKTNSVKVKVTESKKMLGLLDGHKLVVFETSKPWDDINAALAKSVTEAMTTDPKLEQIADLTK